MTSAQRSRIMRAVKDRDTRPELIVRRMLHARQFRYRLHRNDLPGKPDLAFPGRRKVIFVHGCFWHGHHCPRGARTPKTHEAYWKQKIARNVARDAANESALLADGWKVLTVWECELKDRASLEERLVDFLGDRVSSRKNERMRGAENLPCSGTMAWHYGSSRYPTPTTEVLFWMSWAAADLHSVPAESVASPEFHK